MNTRATQAYMQTNVGTADQGRLLLMLYDGALKFLQQAREKMLEKDYAAKGILISKVIDIVNELSSSLNMERGGDLAVNLSNLYFLCTARLLEANLKMSVERLDSVSQILSGLRSAYAQIIDKPEAKQAVAEISARMKPVVSLQQRICLEPWPRLPMAAMPCVWTRPVRLRWRQPRPLPRPKRRSRSLHSPLRPSRWLAPWPLPPKRQRLRPPRRRKQPMRRQNRVSAACRLDASPASMPRNSVRGRTGLSALWATALCSARKHV